MELTYHYLLQHIPDLALILGCCGAPAEWAAETAMRDEVAERLTHEWERLGRPSSCSRAALPTRFERGTCRRSREPRCTVCCSMWGCLNSRLASVRRPAVFDPCSSRYDESARQSVRRIAEQAGISLTELPYSGEESQCCGWGGHAKAAANPKLHGHDRPQPRVGRVSSVHHLLCELPGGVQLT